MFPTGEQPYILHRSSHHALPPAPVRQGKESGHSLALDHDDICRSVALLFAFQLSNTS